MVQRSLVTLLLPILALGAPQHRSWGGKVSSVAATSQAAVNSTPVATSATLSARDAETTASSAPASTATNGGQVTLHNSCSYEVKVDVLAGPGCASSGSSTVAAGSTWTDVLTECSSGNTALKVYGNGSDKPMQFEYGLVAGNVWYDMSFIDCVSGDSDFSQCAGAGWSMGSIGECPTFACSGGSECCTQGYCDPYAEAVDPDPNAGCGAMQGYAVGDLAISIELCT